MIAVGCGTYDVPPGQGGPGTPVPQGPFTITVNSTDPTTNVPITANKADANGTTSGTSSFTLTYAAGTTVQLTAPAMQGLELFDMWTGCTSSVGATCTVTATSNTTVNAVYEPQISLSLQPQYGCCAPPYDVGIGTGELVYVHATVRNGLTDTAVTWSVAGPPGYDCSNNACGSLSVQNGNEFYQTPYPAPPYVVLTATSSFDPVATASVTLTLGQLAGATGAGVAALTVDTSTTTHAISPLIYGVNQFDDGPALQSAVPVTMDRWGGDASTRYNYLLDMTNSGGDYYYEQSGNSNTAFPDTSMVNSQIAQDQQYKATTFLTVPMIGWTAQSPDPTKRGFACGFSIAKYGPQISSDPNHPDCGSGTVQGQYGTLEYNSSPSGNTVVGDGATAVTIGQSPVQKTDPTDTSVAIDQNFVGGWVGYLVNKFGAANAGGVQVYELDNEPDLWNTTHEDVYPFWMTYDKLPVLSTTYATAIKAADPNALVAGPVVSGWENYFLSTADIWAGYNTGPNYNWHQNPADYNSHNMTPFVEYYLQQMAAASTTAGKRLLDYFDLHAYLGASGTANALAGDTSIQAARENSTRALWDTTYTDPQFTDITGAAVPPMVIPRMLGWVSSAYPGTKTSISEYNWGGEESISGAIAEAESLAIFGQQGLDAAALWSEPLKLGDPTYAPTRQAFNFFLNYDGSGSKFGDLSLNTNSVITGGVDSNGNPLPPYFGGAQLAVYAAKRSSDGAITVLVFNKTFQDLTTSITLTTGATTASVYQLSQANLTTITSQPSLMVTSGAASTTFPAQSITLLVFPQ